MFCDFLTFDTLVWNGWFFRVTSVHGREIVRWDQNQTGASKVIDDLILSRFVRGCSTTHRTEILVCKDSQNNHAHTFWLTDPPPLFKSKLHHRHFNSLELFVILYQNISWYFSVIQHVCSCWFRIFFNPRKIIPILNVSYELVVGNFDSDSYKENERYVLSGCLDSFLLKKYSCNYANYLGCPKWL